MKATEVQAKLEITQKSFEYYLDLLEAETSRRTNGYSYNAEELEEFSSFVGVLWGLLKKHRSEKSEYKY